MKFLVDAQLPKTLSALLNEAGHNSIHTIELEQSNASSDDIIRKICSKEKRILITKDTDFENSFLLKSQPSHLILVTTGNISNKELLSLFENILFDLNELFKFNNFIEISRNKIVVRA